MTKDEFEKQTQRCATYKKLNAELNIVSECLEDYDEIINRAKIGADTYRLRTLADAIHSLEDRCSFYNYFDTEKILEDIDEVIQKHFKGKIEVLEDSIKNI